MLAMSQKLIPQIYMDCFGKCYSFRGRPDFELEWRLPNLTKPVQPEDAYQSGRQQKKTCAVLGQLQTGSLDWSFLRSPNCQTVVKLLDLMVADSRLPFDYQ